MESLVIVARLGLSLFITTGFAAGLGLYTGVTLDSPDTARACGGVFCWVMALISCSTCRRA